MLVWRGVGEECERELTLALQQRLLKTDYMPSIPVLSDRVVNVASVPQRSPLRYPGGKTWLVPHIRTWLKEMNTAIHWASNRLQEAISARTEQPYK